MAKMQVFTIDGLTLYDELLKNYVSEEDAKSLKTVSINGNSLNFYRVSEPVGSTAPAYTITLPEADLTGLIPKITGGTTGNAVKLTSTGTLEDTGVAFSSLAKTQDITNAIGGLDVNEIALASESSNVVSIYGIKEVDGKIGKGTSKVDLAAVAKTGSASNVSVSAITGVTTNGSASNTVQDALAALKGLIDDTNSDTEIFVETATGGASDSYSTAYKIYQGGKTDAGVHSSTSTEIATINIPKDMVVSSGSVKSVTSAGTPYTNAKVGDKYIELTIANATSDKLYIPVNDLVDVMQGSTGAEISVSVAADNTISASVNKVAASKIVYTEADTKNNVPEVTVKGAIDSLNTLVGEGYEAISETSIRNLFTTTEV